MSEVGVSAPRPRMPRVSIRWIAAGLVLALAAVAIIGPNLSRSSTRSSRPLNPAADSVDPAVLVGSTSLFPRGTRVKAHRYIGTVEAARRDRNTLAFLRLTGRQIGFERDFSVPGYGEVDVLAVRFGSANGLQRAYAYYLTLPSAQNLHAIPFRGVGEEAALVVGPGVAFTEFRRGRYYTVVTILPDHKRQLDFMGMIARRIDQRMVSFRIQSG